MVPLPALCRDLTGDSLLCSFHDHNTVHSTTLQLLFSPTVTKMGVDGKVGFSRVCGESLPARGQRSSMS